MIIIAFVSSNIVYSQNIPNVLKRNWIAIVHNADNERSFDSLSLLPDNGNIDTAKLFYSYWTYHGKNKFFWGYFDKSEPRSELASGNYEKWKLKGDDILAIKNCKTKDKVYYKIVYNYGNLNTIKNVLLIRLANENVQSNEKRIIGYHK